MSHECRLPSGGLDLVDASQQLSSALHPQILEGHLRALVAASMRLASHLLMGTSRRATASPPRNASRT